MHPPFFPVDHKVDAVHHPRAARDVTRRSQPTRLDIGVTAHGFAPVPMRAAPPPPDAFARPEGPLRLRVVPPPQTGLRDRIGRLLIRIGQRMIFQNHARRV